MTHKFLETIIKKLKEDKDKIMIIEGEERTGMSICSINLGRYMWKKSK